MICSEENNRFSIEKIKNHRFFLGEKFLINFDKKEVMKRNNFINVLKRNFLSYNIKAEIDQKIFLSKTVNFSCMGVHKNYKKIEEKICKDKFRLNLFYN